MNKKHIVEFVDESAKATGSKHDRLTFHLSEEEKLTLASVNGLPFFSGNSAGLIRLGELLIQMGMSDYQNGFHLHINEDFDSEKSELLIIGVQN